MSDLEQACETNEAEDDKVEAGSVESGSEACKGLLSLKRVAEAIGVSTPTARRLVATGKLPGVKLMVNDRLCWKVKPEALKHYLSADSKSSREAKKKNLRSRNLVKPASSDLSQSKNSVPLDAHKSALETARLALERLEKIESLAEEQRTRADLAERQKFALEMELRQYQAALAEQSESLAEIRAEKQAAEMRLLQVTAPIELPLKIETHRPSFGQRVKGWLGLKNAR